MGGDGGEPGEEFCLGGINIRLTHAFSSNLNTINLKNFFNDGGRNTTERKFNKYFGDKALSSL